MSGIQTSVTILDHTRKVNQKNLDDKSPEEVKRQKELQFTQNDD